MTKRQRNSLIARVLRWSFGLLLTALLGLIAYVYLPVLTSPADNYLLRKGSLESASVTNKWRENGSDYTELDLVSTNGLKAQITIRIPINANRPLPVALILGGVGTGRDTCRVIPKIQHSICVSMSYPYHGEKNIEGLAFLYNLREIQQTVKDTPPALMLVLDYVLSQSYSDASQVEVLGVSFGAYFVSIPAVLDQRVTRVWIAHGAAEPVNAMIHYSARESGRQFSKSILVYLVGYAIGSQHVAPEKWVGRISPRPVIMINAEDDTTFPSSSVAVLHNAAKQPKEIIWTKGMHVTPGRKEVVEQISDIILNRIEGDFLKRSLHNR